MVATVTENLYSVDPNWYVDTRAMDHITNDLKRLTTKDPMVVLIKSKSQMGRLVNYLYWKFLSCWIYQTFISEKYSPCSKKLIVTYYMFISLFLTIMLLLSFILIVSLLRIKPRKQSFSKANIKADFMLLLTANQIKHFFQLNSLKSSGTRD